MGFWIVLAVIAGLALWAVQIYNGLVKSKNLVEEGWSGIEAQLKRRADLIPNLVETVKGYASHEREAFDEVTRLRTQSAQAASVDERAKSEQQLSGALGRLLALAEAYPDLKASENFKSLQGMLSETEDQIQLARRYYNGAVRTLNTMIEQFPSNLIATQFKFQEAEFFEIENAADRAVPKVSFQ